MTKVSGKSKKKKSPVSFTNWEILGILVCGLGILFGPIIFVQDWSGFDFTETGAIGDTIGGITAPFINLLAAFLVYKSFTAQISANRDQRDNHDEQMKEIRKEQSLNSVIYLFDSIEKSINDREKEYSFGAIITLSKQLSAEIEQLKGKSDGEKQTRYVLINITIKKHLDTIFVNLSDVERIINIIESYLINYPEEQNVSIITEYFTYKLNLIIIKHNYQFIHNALIKQLSTIEMNAFNTELYEICKTKLTDCQDKIQKILDSL